MMLRAGKFIHLLYAPTNFCNMGCQYCYLGAGTKEKTDTKNALETLQYTIDKCLEQGVTPFNLSFHGGEATAVPQRLLRQLLVFTKKYYRDHGKRIKEAGYPLNPLHIKTNLYNFGHRYDLFQEFQVSISGSVDLPLRLHEKYRTDKQGRTTLPKISTNLKLLAKYPHNKKISCVVTKEHMNHLDEFIQDIKYIHYDIGLDMTKFNVMFAFDSIRNAEKFAGKIAGIEMLSHQEQVTFYQRMKAEFDHTTLEHGLKNHWFKEFTPEFCCSAVNCGDKFFLLQSNGDVYACPRGQSSRQFYYGNVYRNTIPEIMDQGWQTIEALENKKQPNEECYTCKYLPYCNQGCIFVREEAQLTKSYTCRLQQEIYKDNPQKYPAFDEEYIKSYSLKYKFRNNIQAMSEADKTPVSKSYITPELYDEGNALSSLIAKDPVLDHIYSSELFRLRVDGVEYNLKSNILNNVNELTLIKPSSEVTLLVREGSLDLHCPDPVNNTVHLMLLRNTLVSYGDEGRRKQEHLFDYSIYEGAFKASAPPRDGFLHFNLAPLLHQHQGLFMENVRNNLYVTTKALREYHYRKQQKNAFYHLQAINLPFPFL